MQKDVICGMQVDPKKAAGSSEYQGKIYYFCSAAANASLIRTLSSTPTSRNKLGRLRCASAHPRIPERLT